MLSIVLTEFQKIKRYHILLIGIIGLHLISERQRLFLKIHSAAARHQ